MATPEQIAKAKSLGYTDEQINSYLSQKVSTPVETATEIDPIAKAKSLGYTDEQIGKYLQQKGLPKPNNAFRVESDIPAVPDVDPEEAKYLQISPENIIKYSQELGVDPTTQEGMNAIAKKDLQTRGVKWTAKTAREFYANAEEVYDVARPLSWMQAQFGGRAEVEYADLQKQNVKAIIDEAKERGLLLEHDGSRFFTRDQQGNPVSIEPGMLERLGKSKWETIGGVGGALGGLYAASKTMGPLRSLGPWGRAAAGGIAAVGGAVGAVTGDQIDYLEARIGMQENFDARLATEKAIGTAQFSLIAEALGAGMFKLGAASYKATRDAFNHLLTGNTTRAYEILKQSLGDLSDDEVNTIIKGWETLNKKEAPGKNLQEKAMAILSTTQAGGDTIVSKAASRNLAVASAVSNEVAQRARSLLDETAKLADTEAGERILKGLGEYTDDVKNSYSIVKTAGIENAPTDYQFNLNKLSVRPILEQKIATVSDQTVRNRFIRILDDIDNATNSRTFEDLLDLRKAVNKLKYRSSKFSADDIAAVNSSLNEIDAEISKVMKSVGQEDWLKDWKTVNEAYSEYFKVQNNVLFKALTKKGVSADAVANAFVKYGTAIDDNFHAGANTYRLILNKLPAKVKEDVEGLIVQKLTDKHTKGTQGFNAIDFPQLAETLQNYTFVTPRAEQLKQTAAKLAEVYKNDPKLIGLSRLGSANEERGIATTLWGKFKMALVNKTWGRLMSAVPNKFGGELKLVEKVSKLLEDPLNAQTTKQVLADIKNDQDDLAKAIFDLQKEVAKSVAEGTEYQAGRLKLYKDRSGNLYAKPQRGGYGVTEYMAAHRVVGQDTVSGRFGKSLKQLSPADKAKLIKEGYVAILQNDGKVVKLN